MGWFEVSSILPASLLDHFKAWNIATSYRRGKIMWCSSFYAATWCIWNERNYRCFEGRSSRVETLINRINFATTSWVSIRPYFFLEVSIDLMLLNWREVAFSHPMTPSSSFPFILFYGYP